jgi:hypothetical protein
MIAIFHDTAISERYPYHKMELTCPDDTVETFDISDVMLNEEVAVAKQKPTYFREYCADRFNCAYGVFIPLPRKFITLTMIMKWYCRCHHR